MSDKMVKELNGLVADFTVFYQKMRHYHWNVKGKQFFQLHALFEGIYDEVNEVIDELAERVVALGGTPLHTLAMVMDEASISEDSEIPDGVKMVKRTAADLETLSSALDNAIEVAEAEGDRTTVNLLDGMRDGLQGRLWMIKAWQS
ncbi:MAG: DNA starvation/stationary phase protection protein [Anaerolineae bacterium]|nr:DNA starvation/stationary phase protection protein [Anaerolineae bacterium]